MRVGWLVAVVSMAAMIAADALLTGAPRAWFVAIPQIVFAADCVYFYCFVKCPRCRTIFGPFSVWSIARRQACPHCGVDFDQALVAPFRGTVRTERVDP